MGEETAVLAHEAVLADAVLGDSVSGNAVLDDVLVAGMVLDAALPGDVAGSDVADVTGMSLRDLDNCDQSRLAATARRLAGPGRDGW